LQFLADDYGLKSIQWHQMALHPDGVKPATPDSSEKILKSQEVIDDPPICPSGLA